MKLKTGEQLKITFTFICFRWSHNGHRTVAHLDQFRENRWKFLKIYQTSLVSDWSPWLLSWSRLSANNCSGHSGRQSSCNSHAANHHLSHKHLQWSIDRVAVVASLCRQKSQSGVPRLQMVTNSRKKLQKYIRSPWSQMKFTHILFMIAEWSLCGRNWLQNLSVSAIADLSHKNMVSNESQMSAY